MMSFYFEIVPWYIRYSLNIMLTLSLSCMALLYYFQTELIYPSAFPPESREKVDVPSNWKMDDWKEITLTTPDNEKLHCYQINNSNSKVVVLYLHANAGNLGHRLPIAQVFHYRFHASIFMLSYRGVFYSITQYGKSTGKANEKGLKIDAETALKHIKADPVLKNKKIVVYGQSIGGAVGIYLASQFESDLNALIVENTFTSIPRLIPSVMPAIRYFSFLCHQIWPSHESIKSIKRLPVLFLSGSKDKLVPSSHMKELRAILSQARGEVKDLSIQWSEFEEGDHNDTVIQPSYFEEIAKFWEKFVR